MTVTRRLPALAVLATVLSFVVGFLQKLPCHSAGWPRDTSVLMRHGCYSDIPVLFRARGLSSGIFPYSEQVPGPALEYPVVTGYIMDWVARLSRALVPGANDGTAAQAFFLANVVLLLVFAVVTVLAVLVALRRTGGRRGDVLLVAAAPTLALSGTINWDLVAVAAAVLAILAWAYGRPVAAGVLIGAGTAAKLFPLLLLGPLLLLCLRGHRMREFGKALTAGLVSWILLNAPVALLYPDGWLEFWRFNARRPVDFGSIWYALSLLGAPVPAINTVAVATLGVLLLGVAALAFLPRHPPTLAQLGFLTVAAVLLTNKVYSPQYVLWALPLLVLARARAPIGRVLRDWTVWQAAEVCYWFAVWRYLADPLTEDWFTAAIIVRVAAIGYLCAQVIREVSDQASPQTPPLAAETAVNEGQSERGSPTT